MWRDLAFAVRSLRRSPLLAITVIAILGLGIGGSAALFTFVQNVLFEPLDLPDADRLVMVCETHPERPSDWCGGAPGNLWDWQQAESLDSMGLARGWSFSLTDGDRVRGLRGGMATSGLFETLAVVPARGRLFARDDHREGAEPAVLLSEELWRDQWGADEAVVGGQIQLDGDPVRVIGVLPAATEVPGLEGIELWLALPPARAAWRDWRGLRPFARLADGATRESAQLELAGIDQRLGATFPESNADWDVRVTGLRQHMVSRVQTALWVLFGAVGMLLVVACFNVAGLLGIRATAQRREFAVRRALGAEARAVLRLMFAQACVLGVAAAALGVLTAWALVRWFRALAPADFPRLDEVSLDPWTGAFAVLAAFLASVVGAVLPAMRLRWSQIFGALRAGRVEARGDGLQRSVLVVAQLGVATVLLIGAGLLLRSFSHLADWQPGFAPERVVAFSVFPPAARYADAESLFGVYERIRSNLSSVPGVESVGAVSAGPMFGGGDGVSEFSIEGRPSAGTPPVVAWFDAGVGYFETLRIPVLEGRTFGAEDRRGAAPVAVINETMARRHWSGDDSALGARIRVEDYETTFEIVGVVADVEPFDARDPVTPKIYWPQSQFVRGASFFAVRSSGLGEELIPSLSARLEQIDPELGVGRMATLEERKRAALVEPRFQAALLAMFSGLAFLIAAFGLYGAISYAVLLQRRELGLRMALGAQRAQIFGLVFQRGIALVGLAGALGLLGSFVLSRALSSLLVEVHWSDPWTLGSVLLTLVVLAVAATAVPAARAAGGDLMERLRTD